jgi:hypothetical protein
MTGLIHIQCSKKQPTKVSDPPADFNIQSMLEEAQEKQVQFIFWLLNLWDEGTMILQNVSNYWPNNTVSHPRTTCLMTLRHITGTTC